MLALSGVQCPCWEFELGSSPQCFRSRSGAISGLLLFESPACRFAGRTEVGDQVGHLEQGWNPGFPGAAFDVNHIRHSPAVGVGVAADHGHPGSERERQAHAESFSCTDM